MGVLTHFLLAAAARGNAAAIEDALDAGSGWIDERGPHPYWGGEVTLLHLAAEWGRGTIVELLLANGANPNPDSSGYDGWTPLQSAIHREHGGVVRQLLDGGAVLTIWAAAALGLDADVALMGEQVHDLGPNRATPLHFAATVAVAECLVGLGARLDVADKYGRTPAAAVATYGPRYREAGLYLTGLAEDMDFARAIALGDLEAVKRLYDGAVVVLPVAAGYGYAEVVEFLLEQGADPNAGFPLHQAVRYGRLDVAHCLLAHGAEATLADTAERATPLEWAQFHDQPAMEDLLRRWVG